MGVIVFIIFMIVVGVFLLGLLSKFGSKNIPSALTHYKAYAAIKPELTGKEEVFGCWECIDVAGYMVFNPDGTVVTDCIPGKIGIATSGTYYVDSGNEFDMYFGSFGVEAKYQINSRNGADYMTIIMESRTRMEMKKIQAVNDF